MVVYILRSQKTKKYYTGVTEDLATRLEQHNAGRNSSTRRGVPWDFTYTKSYGSRSEALKRERLIKSRGAGGFLRT